MNAGSKIRRAVGVGFARVASCHAGTLPARIAPILVVDFCFEPSTVFRSFGRSPRVWAIAQDLNHESESAACIRLLVRKGLMSKGQAACDFFAVGSFAMLVNIETIGLHVLRHPQFGK